MNIGKLILRHNELFVRDLTTDQLHHVDSLPEVQVGDYASFEINENDGAVDLKRAADAFVEAGYCMGLASFYRTIEDEDAESYFGTCEFTGIKGNVVPCIAQDTNGNIVEFVAGDWLVHSVLGKLAGAF